MRVESPSVAKENKSAMTRTQQIPREGTKIREMYDMLCARKGIPIDVALSRMGATKNTQHLRVIEDLRDYYGLDIRKISYGRWVLAGEWFGRTYVDYIAERINKAER